MAGLIYEEHLVTSRVSGPCAECKVYLHSYCHITRRIVPANEQEGRHSPTSVAELWCEQHCKVCHPPKEGK